jgi:hypothetical protein
MRTSNPSKRFAAYAALLEKLATDVPWLPLELHRYNWAVSKRFSWPTFSGYRYNRPWALEIRAR